MKVERFIVIVEVGLGIDRRDLDDASSHLWGSKEQYLRELSTDKKVVENIRLIPVYEFAEWWNNQDSDTPVEERADCIIQSTWMGYCQIKIN